MPQPSGTNHPMLAGFIRGASPPPGSAQASAERYDDRGFPSSDIVKSRTRLQEAAQRDCGDNSAGAHLFPFRTEKLRPAAPMILPEEGGKVGRRPMPQRLAEMRAAFFCRPDCP